jgi:hypothetical protein
MLMMRSAAAAVEIRHKPCAYALENRFAECGLRLHPEKTKIVYCKDDERRGDYPNQKFDFLGYTFRPRLSRRWRGTFGVVFSPAASDKALKTIRQTVRSWTLHERSDKSLDDLARMFNSHIRGWINYYGRYYKSALYPTLRHIDRILARWAHRKFKSLRHHRRQTAHWIARVARRQPRRKGQLLLRQGQSEAAEELYRKALSIAEEQRAKLWELRGAVSFAQLRRNVADHAAEPDAQKLELAPGALELVCMRIAPDHNRGAFG